MTPHPQQEYIITDEELNTLHEFIQHCPSYVDDIVETIRSRPAPAAPNCDNCAELMAKAREHGFEAGRNQTLDEVIENISNFDNHDITRGETIRIVESLRTQQHNRGDQR